MYHNPRRPFYKSHNDNMPHDDNSPHSAVIDSKRFWKLVKKLTRRQEQAQEIYADDQDEVANAG